jgi:hypothetical protein
MEFDALESGDLSMKRPRCGSSKLRKESGERRLALLLRAVVLPIRCYWCGHHFYRPTALAEELQPAPSYGRLRRAA